MSHNTEILDILRPWKRESFRGFELPMDKVCKSLYTETPLIEAKPAKKGSRWIIYNSGTDKVALFCHAFIWVWGCDFDTGNYVPPGEVAPDGLPERRIQNQPSSFCEFSYAVDTEVDPSFYSNMRLLEKFMVSQPGFNKANRPRKQWQDGRTEALRQRYIFASKIFVQKSPHNTRDGAAPTAPYKIHPWILRGLSTEEGKAYIPNPSRPKLLERIDGSYFPLESSSSPMLDKGDIVWISFKVAFTTMGNGWAPEFAPVEIVRVGKLPERTAAAMDHNSWPASDEDFPELPIGPQAVSIPQDTAPRSAKPQTLGKSNQHATSLRYSPDWDDDAFDQQDIDDNNSKSRPNTLIAEAETPRKVGAPILDITRTILEKRHQDLFSKDTPPRYDDTELVDTDHDNPRKPDSGASNRTAPSDKITPKSLHAEVNSPREHKDSVPDATRTVSEKRATPANLEKTESDDIDCDIIRKHARKSSDVLTMNQTSTGKRDHEEYESDDTLASEIEEPESTDDTHTIVPKFKRPRRLATEHKKIAKKSTRG